MLASQLVKFGATTAHKVVFESDVGAPHGNFGTGVRTIKAHVVNDGDNDVVVTLDGSAPDEGYGLDWTTRATKTVKARANAILEGAIRGQETKLRIAVETSSGVTEGTIDIFEASDNFRR